MPRRYAQYKPASSVPSVPEPTNVGGYEDLKAYFHSKGEELHRSAHGLAAVDSLIGSPTDKASLAQMTWAIGMFYGDVLTHSIDGAHWHVTTEDSPEVRITPDTSIAVIFVAPRRVTLGAPTLVQNYNRALEIVAREG
ncbi:MULTISPECIES: DUF6278 family protein [unclassified Arthrobacter]|uniref:DUF6278 family protein n=1 Tax=unclassified Arthrobacter TaxID=235627 RepID=UPI0027D7F641|nr:MULTISPECIES: DUF6278 family protein [unclassified Arthrobacter]